jgi:uncharacterized integral membrane protein (TIGR00697 family)
MAQSKYLWFLVMSYAMVLVMANWYDPRLVQIFHLNTDGGTVIFPVSFLLADIVTEVYGYKFARLAIWLGFFWNLIFSLYGLLITHLPNPSFISGVQPFDHIFGLDVRIIFASLVSYFCAEPLNAFIIAKLKILFQGRGMALRFVASTVFASLVDSSVFTLIAFSGVIPSQNILVFILSMWGIKVLIEVCGLFVSVPLAKFLKRREGLDRYDIGTRFSLFSLDTRY